MTRSRPEPRPARIESSDPDEQLLARYSALLPDPKPDDLLVERVWRKMHPPAPEPRRASPWRWAVAAASAVILIEGAALLWLTRPRPQADVLLSEGGVFTGGVSWVPARQGDPLRAGTRLRSDASGRSVLRIPGVAALFLGTEADLSLQQLGRATALNLERGTVTARVTKRPKDSPFSVRAGEFTVTVVGTLFSVSDTDHRVEVSVSEGVVEVAGRGEHWRVEAGHRWSSEASGEQAEGGVPPARVALLLAAASTPPSQEVPELFRDLVRSETSTAIATATETPTPTDSAGTPHPASPLQGRGEPPTATQPPTAFPRPRPRHPAAPLVARLDPASREPTVVPPLVLAPTPTPAPPPPAVVHDYYAEALDLSRHGHHQKAAAILEKALASPGETHDLELYQLALLRQRHLNDPRGALDALLSYRKLYPQGSLRQEVDLSVVEVDRTLGRSEAALAESAYFLTQHPLSERADELRVLRGDLLRQRGDCTAAGREYRAVTAGAALDDALYYGAYCRRELGDSEAARSALRDYLARFPSGRHAAAAREALGQ